MNCGSPVPQSAKFCANCGKPVDEAAPGGNTVNTKGGDIHGGVMQGRDFYLHQPAPAAPIAEYEAVPIWRSPLTLAALSWVGLGVGLVSILPAWKGLEPLIGLMTSGEVQDPDPLQYVWVFAFVGLAAVLALTLALIWVAKTETRWPLSFGLAVSGLHKRITLERIKPGPCPKCGGKMHYINKVTQERIHYSSDGKQRREVVERTPTLQCARNAKHAFEVDPTEPAS